MGFVSGQIVKNIDTVYGTVIEYNPQLTNQEPTKNPGKSGPPGARIGEEVEISPGFTGEVLSSGPGDYDICVAIYPIHSTGELEPHLIRVEDFNISFKPAVRHNPFIWPGGKGKRNPGRPMTSSIYSQYRNIIDRVIQEMTKRYGPLPEEFRDYLSEMAADDMSWLDSGSIDEDWVYERFLREAESFYDTFNWSKTRRLYTDDNDQGVEITRADRHQQLLDKWSWVTPYDYDAPDNEARRLYELQSQLVTDAVRGKISDEEYKVLWQQIEDAKAEAHEDFWEQQGTDESLRSERHQQLLDKWSNYDSNEIEGPNIVAYSPDHLEDVSSDLTSFRDNDGYWMEVGSPGNPIAKVYYHAIGNNPSDYLIAGVKLADGTIFEIGYGEDDGAYNVQNDLDRAVRHQDALNRWPIVSTTDDYEVFLDDIADDLDFVSNALRSNDKHIPVSQLIRDIDERLAQRGLTENQGMLTIALRNIERGNYGRAALAIENIRNDLKYDEPEAASHYYGDREPGDEEIARKFRHKDLLDKWSSEEPWTEDNVLYQHRKKQDPNWEPKVTVKQIIDMLQGARDAAKQIVESEGLDPSLLYTTPLPQETIRSYYYKYNSPIGNILDETFADEFVEKVRQNLWPYIVKGLLSSEEVAMLTSQYKVNNYTDDEEESLAESRAERHQRLLDKWSTSEYKQDYNAYLRDLADKVQRGEISEEQWHEQYDLINELTTEDNHFDPIGMKYVWKDGTGIPDESYVERQQRRRELLDKWSPKIAIRDINMPMNEWLKAWGTEDTSAWPEIDNLFLELAEYKKVGNQRAVNKLAGQARQMIIPIIQKEQASARAYFMGDKGAEYNIEKLRQLRAYLKLVQASNKSMDEFISQAAGVSSYLWHRLATIYQGYEDPTYSIEGETNREKIDEESTTERLRRHQDEAPRDENGRLKWSSDNSEESTAAYIAIDKAAERPNLYWANKIYRAKQNGEDTTALEVSYQKSILRLKKIIASAPIDEYLKHRWLNYIEDEDLDSSLFSIRTEATRAAGRGVYNHGTGVPGVVGGMHDEWRDAFEADKRRYEIRNKYDVGERDPRGKLIWSSFEDERIGDLGEGELIDPRDPRYQYIPTTDQWKSIDPEVARLMEEKRMQYDEGMRNLNAIPHVEEGWRGLLRDMWTRRSSIKEAGIISVPIPPADVRRSFGSESVGFDFYDENDTNIISSPEIRLIFERLPEGGTYIHWIGPPNENKTKTENPQLLKFVFSWILQNLPPPYKADFWNKKLLATIERIAPELLHPNSTFTADMGKGYKIPYKQHVDYDKGFYGKVSAYKEDDPLDEPGLNAVTQEQEVPWWTMNRQKREQAVANALRVGMLSPLKLLKFNAVHYQDISKIPGNETNPQVYIDQLQESKRKWDARGQTDLFSNPDEVDPYDPENSEAYAGFIHRHLQFIANVSAHISELTDAAEKDVQQGGEGFIWRDAIKAIDLPGVNNKVAAFAWLLLCPNTSELGTIDSHMMRALGADERMSQNPEGYEQLEKELRVAKDQLGYQHMPLGKFQWGLWDYMRTPPDEDGYHHQSHSAMKVLDPLHYKQIKWHKPINNSPIYGERTRDDLDWWNSTEPDRMAVRDEYLAGRRTTPPSTQEQEPNLFTQELMNG